MKFNVDDLVEQKLVRKKAYTSGPYKGLSILKYTNRVHYDNLWHLDERLLECRGIVVDEEDNVIVRPFPKVFNVGENGLSFDPDQKVAIARKVNGFMLAVTPTIKYGLIVSTTGSLDSEFVALGLEWVETLNKGNMQVGYTYLFEVCDPSDPHIVEETPGIYYLGQRDIENGTMSQIEALSTQPYFLNCKAPDWDILKFKEIDLDVEHEGWAIYCPSTGNLLGKIKSKHYLSKKLLMRLSGNRVDKMYENPKLFKQNVDEEFYGIIDSIISVVDKETWKGYSDQERREFIEENIFY